MSLKADFSLICYEWKQENNFVCGRQISKKKQKQEQVMDIFAGFLYRALRFSEQYDWFFLSPNLNKMVNKFNEDYILPKNCTNNIPSKKD